MNLVFDRGTTTDVMTIDALNFFVKVLLRSFYRHVESKRGTSIIFETVSSLLAHR